MTDTKLQEPATADSIAEAASATSRAKSSRNGVGSGSKAETDGPDASVEAKPAAAETKDGDGRRSPPPHPGERPPLVGAAGSTATGREPGRAPLFMAHDAQLRWGVPLGAVFVGVAAWGVMDLLGTFDDPERPVATSTTLERARPAPRARGRGARRSSAAPLYGGQAGRRSAVALGAHRHGDVPRSGSPRSSSSA